MPTGARWWLALWAPTPRTGKRCALSGITDASATKPYLLQVEAGTYDLGGGFDTSTLVMKEHEDIRGAG